MPEIKSRKQSNKKLSPENKNINTFISTLIFSLIVYCVVFIIISLIGLAVDISSALDYYISLASFAVSSFASGFFAGAKLRKNGLLCGAIFTLPANLIIVLLSLISNGFVADINLIITALVLVFASAAGGVLAVNKRYRR